MVTNGFRSYDSFVRVKPGLCSNKNFPLNAEWGTKRGKIKRQDKH